MRASLIDTVTILCDLYGELTELSSCGLRKSGRIFLAVITFEPRLRRRAVQLRLNRGHGLKEACTECGRLDMASVNHGGMSLFLPINADDPRVLPSVCYAAEWPVARARRM
jgi:hypothetical protein